MTGSAVHFTQTITLGAILLGLLVGGSGLVVFFHGVRWKNLFELEKSNAESLAEGREAFRLRAERLEAELAAERVKTDLTELLKQGQQQHAELLHELADSRRVGIREIDETMQQHEARALTRHEQIVAVLNAIRDALVRQQ